MSARQIGAGLRAMQAEPTVTVTVPWPRRGADPSPSVRGGWAERAACRAPGIDPELFFPVSNVGPAQLQVGEAKRICARCPVILSCLRWALWAREPAGIWGGTTPEERHSLRVQDEERLMREEQ